MVSIQTVAIVGAGIMGHGIAQVCAQGGKKVILIDSFPEVVETAKTKIAKNVKLFQDNNLLSVRSVDEVMSHIEFTTNLARAAEAEMVIEAIPEKFDLRERPLSEAGADLRARNHPGNQYVGHPHHEDRRSHPISRKSHRHAFLHAGTSHPPGGGHPDRQN